MALGAAPPEAILVEGTRWVRPLFGGKGRVRGQPAEEAVKTELRSVRPRMPNFV